MYGRDLIETLLQADGVELVTESVYKRVIPEVIDARMPEVDTLFT